MNELQFRNSSVNLTDDDRTCDNFATQFVTSLVNRSTPESTYWHGRLIGLSDIDGDDQWEEYSITFLGSTYTEKQFREKLEKREIVITKFEIPSGTQLRYVPVSGGSASHLDERTITHPAHIEALVDGRIITGTVQLTHRIRRTYLSFNTVVG